MPKVKVNDIQVYYEVYVEGFPLIMIMGLDGLKFNLSLSRFVLFCSVLFCSVCVTLCSLLSTLLS
jgi:hypothetical protein